MNIKYSRMNQVKGSLTMQKALALAIYLKYKVGKNSTIRNYNPNKIQTLTGVSSNTFRKYLPWMEKMGLVAYEGKSNQHMVIVCLQSKNMNRNINIESFCFDTYKDVYRSLRTYIMLDIQRRKDYIYQLLQTCHNPKNFKEYKKARKKVRKYMTDDVIRHTEYHDYGISYRFIAQTIGCCKRTAQRVVQYAVDKGWCIKEQHWWRVFLPGVHFLEVDGYTFTTENYGYVIGANHYRLSPAVSSGNAVGTYRW